MVCRKKANNRCLLALESKWQQRGPCTNDAVGFPTNEANAFRKYCKLLITSLGEISLTPKPWLNWYDYMQWVKPPEQN